MGRRCRCLSDRGAEILVKELIAEAEPKPTPAKKAAKKLAAKK